MITFARIRPAESVNETWARTRHREGTTALELGAPTADDRAGALAGGVLPVATRRDEGGVEPAAWVVGPDEALELAAGGVPGWRITVLDGPDREAVLDAVARSRAAFLRAGRSHVAESASIVSLPSISSSVSVFVDSVPDAVEAVETGATDLLLRDWDTDSIGELRATLAPQLLVERTALPVGVSVDEARAVLDREMFKAYLDQVDGSGAARPRYEWAPGMDMAAPVPGQRLSAEWPDSPWLHGDGEQEARFVAGDIRQILGRSLDGIAP